MTLSSSFFLVLKFYENNIFALELLLPRMENMLNII